MERKTELLVEADIQIWANGPESLQEITVRDIPCVWEWDKSSRDAAAAWAVHDWIDNTFGNNIETYWILCVVSSPVKGEK